MTKNEVESIFQLAGIEIKKTWEIVNKYWPNTPTYDAVRTPWWLVKTNKGIIEIGWRKRVISIDWSDTDISCMVTEDDVTKDFDVVHAYSAEKAISYLKTLSPLLK